MQPVLIDINAPEARIFSRLKNIDALLLTGGREQFYEFRGEAKAPSAYLSKVARIVGKVKAMNDSGFRMPIWATCLGFEALILSQANYELVRHNVRGQEKVLEPVKIENFETMSAKFFSDEEREFMSRAGTFYFNHKFGFFARQFSQNGLLKESLKVVATVRQNKEPLVAWVEFDNYPFFASQFHPEKLSSLSTGIFRRNKEELMRARINRKLSFFLKSQAVDRNRNVNDVEEGNKNVITLKNIGEYSSLDLILREKEN